MEIQILPPEKALPVARAYVISAVINSFKGRKDVEVHLFRPGGDDKGMESCDWNQLLDDHHHPDVEYNPEATKRFILEAFTEDERDAVIAYLQDRYEAKMSQVTACPIDFPVPIGITPLSDIPDWIVKWMKRRFAAGRNA